MEYVSNSRAAASAALVELLVARARATAAAKAASRRPGEIVVSRYPSIDALSELNKQLKIAVNLLKSVTPKAEIESWAVKSPLKWVPAHYVDARKGNRRSRVTSGCQSYMFA